MKTVRLEKIPDPYDYLNLSAVKDFTYFRTVVMDEGVMIDFNIRDEPAAIEIIDASRKFGMHHEPCMKGKITGYVHINYDFIVLRLNVVFEKLSKSYECEVPNIYGLRPGEYEIDVI